MVERSFTVSAPLPLRPLFWPGAMGRRGFALLAAACFALLCPTHSFADSRAAPIQNAQAAGEAQAFDIPAGPLAASLNALSRAAGLTLAFEPAQVAGKTAPALSGVFTPRQALAQLLVGSGLVYRFTDASTVTLTQADTSDAGGPLALSPITVLGERRAQALAETTSSVAVLDEDDIRRTDSVRGVYDAIRSVPNVTPSTPEEVPIIRGVRGGGPAGAGRNILLGGAPRVSLIVDDVARIQQFSNTAFQSVFDLEQVDVFRGPQTTLRGANAIAGAVVAKTKDPSFVQEVETFGQVDWNEFSEFGGRGAAMVNQALVPDQLALRAVFEYQKGRNPFVVEDPPGNFFGPAPEGTDFDSLSEFDNVYTRGKFLFEPEALSGLSLLLTGEYQRGRDIGFDNAVSGRSSNGGVDPRDERVQVFGTQRILDVETYAVTLNGAYDFGDIAEIRSITSYQDAFFESAPDNTDLLVFDDVDARRFSQDLVLALDGVAGIVDGVIGVSALFEEDKSELPGGLNFVSSGERRTFSGFADLTVAVTDSLDLIAGARVQYDDAELDVNALSGLASVDFDNTETVFLPKVGASYAITPEHTVFATVRRGYNPGGASVNFGTLQPYQFDPEFVWTFEAGWRGSFFDNRLEVDATAFYNIYDDYQFLLSRGGANAEIVNFDGETYGAEIEARARPIERLQLGFGLGLLSSDIDQPDQAIDGNEFGFDPATTLTASAVWEPIDNFFFDTRLTYVSEYYSTFEELPGTEAGDYVMIDFGAEYSTGPLSIRAFVRNVTDEAAYFERFSADGSGNLLQPRIFGGSVTLRF